MMTTGQEMQHFLFYSIHQPMLIIDRIGGVYGLPFGIKSGISIEKTLAQYLAQ